MSTPESFVRRFEAYCARAGLQPATVSTRVLGNGERFALLKAGRLNIGVRTLAEASARLAALEADLQPPKPADEDWAKPALTGEAA